ncbi:MAG: response regulator [Thermodesulfobacteriota bacterium]
MTEKEIAERVKIMVVDDEVLVAQDLKHRLENLGYEVSAIAHTGEEAIAGAKETRPDLVIMDIQLRGEMDGIEAAEAIKDSFGISVLYLTAFSDDATLERAKVTLPFAYLLKPFVERELHSTIEMALYRQKMEREVKVLKGLLPICAMCKKIRDDKGYWNQIEEYIRDNSEAEFTHGYCRDCATQLLEDARRK